ncbi:MAG: SDR family oxidoreductase [Methanobacteriaceae archaeon]|nr:SDR family oxidoreductase [Methanobacteriaceae archaeon]
MQNKNIVVTGGLGFIGSHLVDKLLENNQVTIIDDKSSGKLTNLDNPQHKNLEIIVGGINELDLKEIFQDKDYVFHQAAMASVPLSVDKPEEAHRINATGTLKVLVAARDSGIKKLLNASSSALYGDNTNMPLKETERINPLSPYAVAKASAEQYCQVFTEVYGLETVSFRYFNVFGPRQNPESQYAAVIPKFIDSLLNGRSPVIYGDGNQSRDFIFVSDVVDANITACESKYSGVLNLACGKALSVNDLFLMIKNILGSPINAEYLEERSGDIKHSLAEVSALRNIGFEPNIEFEKQLRETIEWFQSSPETLSPETP